MLRALLRDVFDLVVPPRASERVVRTLSLDELQTLRAADGCLPYHDPRVTALIWEINYRANKSAAALGGILLYEELLALATEELGAPLLVPIPMHQNRRRQRGHNHTEVLCVAALAHLGNASEYAPNTLRRIIDTKTQQGLPKAERLRNVVRSMEAVQTERIAGRVCVVVDDVATTGATLAEARRALRAAGARGVHTIALARS